MTFALLIIGIILMVVFVPALVVPWIFMVCAKIDLGDLYKRYLDWVADIVGYEK